MSTHGWEFIVYQSCIETRDKGARYCSDEHHSGSEMSHAFEAGQRARGDQRRCPQVATEGEGGGEHPEVEDQSGREMCRETVLGDPRHGFGVDDLLLETGFDHVPPNDPLHSDSETEEDEAGG